MHSLSPCPTLFYIMWLFNKAQGGRLPHTAWLYTWLDIVDFDLLSQAVCVCAIPSSYLLTCLISPPASYHHLEAAHGVRNFCINIMCPFCFLYPSAGSGSEGHPRHPVTPRTPYRTPRPTHSPRSGPRYGPDACEGHFDTIAILRGEMFVFKVTFFYLTHTFVSAYT